jgi:hypothetical protein
MHQYRLKDDLAGKRATCKNPDCRKVFVIPAPIPAEEVEQVAVSLLADEPAVSAPQETDTIAMNCDYCGHHWQEPRSKAGKNVLCPECRQRLRVPVPHERSKSDWRHAATQLPTLARQNLEKLDGVVDASQATLVSGQALQQAGVTEVELEPRPLREKLLIALLVVGGIGILGGGIYYLLHHRQTQKSEQLLTQIQDYWQKGVSDLNETEATLGQALLDLVLAEEALRYNQPEKFKQAHTRLQNARQQLRQAPAQPLRHVLALESALLAIRLGGDQAQVAGQLRLPWLPDLGGQGMRRVDRQRNVHEELRLSLSLLQGADYDLRLGGICCVARFLVEQDQLELALEALPLMCFQDSERNEVRAFLALQAHQLNKRGERLHQVSQELLSSLKAANNGSGTIVGSPAVLVLGQVTTSGPVATSGQVPSLPKLPTQGTIPDAWRYTHVLDRTVKGEHDEAVHIAQRPGSAESQLKASLLAAECCVGSAQTHLTQWLQTAQTIVTSNKKKANVRFPDGQLLRWCQLAASINRVDVAQLFADSIRDENLRWWANAEILREQGPFVNERLPDDRCPIPGDLRKITVAHLWGRFWMARHNARLSRDLSHERRALAGWSPNAVYAFGLAGAALGWQDP